MSKVATPSAASSSSPDDMELAGVTVYVRDWAAAVEWYRDVLGLPVGPYEPDHEFCMMIAGSGFIGLATDHPEYAQGSHENRPALRRSAGRISEALPRPLRPLRR